MCTLLTSGSDFVWNSLRDFAGSTGIAGFFAEMGWGNVAMILVAFFLLYLANPYLSCREIMHQSKNLMKGNRIRYFYLLVSFVGIALLGVVSLGIGFLWITPYMSMTEVEFYRDLINEHSQEF